jgi:hypothetical protein
VPKAFYTTKQLADVITDSLNAGAGAFGATDWACEYYESGNTSGSYFSIATVSSAVAFRIRPQNQNQLDDLCNLMGFSFPPQQFTVQIDGSYAPMCYTPYFDIVSQNLTKKQNVRDNSTNNITGQSLLARVYLSQPDVNVVRDRTDVTSPQTAECSLVGVRPFNLYRQFDTPKQIYWDAKEFIGVIDLTLIDYKGRVLFNPAEAAVVLGPGDLLVGNCGNSTNYQLTLQVTET